MNYLEERGNMPLTSNQLEALRLLKVYTAGKEDAFKEWADSQLEVH